MNKKLLISTTILMVFLMALSPSMMVIGQEPIYGGTLNVPLSADAHALNPLFWTTTYEASIIWRIYDPLVRLDLENVGQPCIAESWSHSTDYTEWTFTIRDDVYWHDGKKLTIDDVYYTYDLLLNDDNITRRSWLFDEITTLETDGNDLIITFGWGPKPADVLYDLATSLIIPEHIWSDIEDISTFANDKPIGSGPFKFVEWEKTQYFRLKKHDQYQFPIYIDGITIPIISEVEAQFYALAGDEIEVMANPPPELEEAGQYYNASVHTALNDYWVYLGMNQRRYPNNVTDFRKAVMYGIDRQEIVDVIKYGRGAIMPASCNLPWGTYYNPDAKTYDYNITKSNELLDALGWVDTNADDIREDGLGQPLEFDCIVSSNAQESVDTVKFIKRYLEDIGVKVNVVPLIWDVLWTTVGGTGDQGPDRDYDWAVLGWVGFWSDFHPSSFYWLLGNDYWGTDQVNIPGWNSSVRYEVADLCEDVLYETDEEVVQDLIDEIQELVAEDLPYITINVNGGTYLYRTDEYKDWQLGPTDGPDNYWTWINIKLIQPPEKGPGFLALGAMLALVITVAFVKFRRRKD